MLIRPDPNDKASTRQTESQFLWRRYTYTPGGSFPAYISSFYHDISSAVEHLKRSEHLKMDSPASRTDNELHHTTVFVDFSHLDAIPSKKASVEIPESATYNNDRPMATSIAAASKGDLQSSEATIPGLDLAAAARRRRRTAAGKRIAAFVWRCFAAAGLRALGRAARAIQRMWAANKSRIMKQRCLRFTMNGLISMETSQKIFAQLLGIRVRRLARSDRTKQAKVAISELSAVLNDIPTSSRSASDTAFARSISSQIRHLRLSVWNFFFEYSIWRTLPPPGYWLVGVPAPKLDAALTISTARITPSLAHVPNVARNVGISPKEYTAPKGTRPATAPSDGAAHKISGIMERQNENAQSNGVSASTAKKGPVTLAAFIQKSSGGKLSEAALPLLTNQSATTIIDERPLTGLGGGRAIFTAMAAASDLLLRKSSPTAVHGGKSHEIGAITAPAKNIGNTAKNNNAKVRSAGSSENKPSFEIQSLREPTSGPFIDLWVSSASRLMPASRGKVPKDTFGAPIPDRMPSVRVVLSMPKSIGSQEMKKVNK